MNLSRSLVSLCLIASLTACSDAQDTGPGAGSPLGDGAGADASFNAGGDAGRTGVDGVVRPGTDGAVVGPGDATGDDGGPTGPNPTLDGGAGTEDISAWTPPETPSIVVDPALHTFSYISPLAAPMVRQITVGNMGQSPLHVTSIEFSGASSTGYAWVLKPTTPKTLAPGKWTMFEVRFACDVMGGPCNGADGFIEVLSDDPETPVSTITLTSQIKATVASPEPCGLLNPASLNFGQVLRGEFKEMQATLTNCGDTDSLTVNNITRSSFIFIPLTDELQMDLEGQTPLTLGPGEAQVITVKYAPLLAGPDAGYFTLHTSDPGDPTMQLDVSGVGISPPLEEIGLTIKLTWDTDETDVDSHFIAPNGTFFDCDLDCHYQNPAPDWGVQGDWLDDPFLDVDDVDGYGPEHVNISEPEPGTYTFILHYYDDTWDMSGGLPP